ncbi:MAG: rod shape-determining protein MreD [Paracoccus sp. (in: a-proteobacteria)]|nr:rod shape-determining protein MreD [Paracoccus sp. (in: a-proteobacteria)]
MTPGLPRARLAGMVVFVLVSLALIAARLIPVSPGEIPRPGPELMLCLTFAWVLRRPDQLPAPVIVALFVIEDLLLMRPFGLWAALVLLGSEQLRHRSQRWRDQGFVFEWLRVSALIVLLILAYRVIMALFLLPVPGLAQVALQIIATWLAYPVVVLVARLVLRLRSRSQAEIERLI